MAVRYPPHSKLAVNLKEAEKFGVEIPNSVIAQADTIIR
jgi:ABC-type uncharacterized transport system substrate-binding protein